MTNNLLFNFTVDKNTSTVFVTREFAAGLSLVWDAFTKPEILDQWWAPKPWVSKTRHMDFKPGGRRFYAMVSPEGQEHWSVQDYTEITPTTNFKFLSAFSDPLEKLDDAFPPSAWNHDFSEAAGSTAVSIVIDHKTPEALERMIQMGFQGGFTMILDYLDRELLPVLTGKP